MTTTTHSLTNGVSNFIFSVAGNKGFLTTINEWGVEIEKEEMTVPALRKMWAAALKNGCKRGWTAPLREQPSVFETDDNRWERELALKQD